MTTLRVLDIGAGPFLGFATDFCLLNPTPKTFLSTDICFADMSPVMRTIFGVRNVSRARALVDKGSRGRFRADGSYEAFPVHESSLDMVFLNCWHPYSGLPLEEIRKEVLRGLKPGGVFFWSHPRSRISFDMPGLVRLKEGSFQNAEKGLWGPFLDLRKETLDYPRHLPYKVPVTGTMRHAIVANNYRRKHGAAYPDSGYIYRGGNLPLPYGVYLKT